LQVYQSKQLELEQLQQDLAASNFELRNSRIRSLPSKDDKNKISKLEKENEELRIMLRRCKKEKDSQMATYPRKLKKVAIVMPFTNHHFLRTKENLLRWQEFYPCDEDKKYSEQIDFVLYYNNKLGSDLESQQKLNELHNVLVYVTYQ
jgi:hypothetical protein